MKYILNESSTNNYNDIENLKNNLLEEKGIENIKAYLNPTKNNELNYNLLDNMSNAVNCLLKHINNNDNIFIIVDSDCDGYTSSAALINYLNKSFNKVNIRWQIHDGKQHGISPDINIPKDTDLLIVPDAGSNDYKQQIMLTNKNIDIIILDHHEVSTVHNELIELDNGEKTNINKSIIVNNQLCKYPNKSLSGVGIVYKFLQALDEELWQNYADDYLDLVSLGLIGDSMDIKNIETKYYILQGLNNVKNKQFKALINKQEYSMKGIININNVAFYIVPLINAMIRVGKQDEKELLFKGFIEEYDEFDYKQRGKKELIKEDIYTRSARLCSNTKSRQDKLRDKAFDFIINSVNETKQNDKVLIVNCKNKFNKELTGVIAIKVATKYNKPCLLLNKSDNVDGLYHGSARNTDKNAITDLKQILKETNLFKMTEGHKQAFGVQIFNENIPKVINILNEKFKDTISDEKIYKVDFIIPFEELQDEFIAQLNLLKDLWGRGVNEPILAIENIEVKASEIQLLGKTKNTIKFNIDGVDFIKFKIDENDKLSNNNEDGNKIFNINVVGRCSMNLWNNKSTPQVIIEDYEINNN